MKMRKLTLFVMLAALLLAALCTGCPLSNGGGGGHPLGSPKNSILYQIAQIRAGDAERLKACLTERVRGEVTPEVVGKARAELDKHTFEELYASEEIIYDSAEYPGENGARKLAKIKMKNGRTLTTMVEKNGEWLADTLWFK